MKQLPKPRYKIGDVLVGRFHPAMGKTVMFTVLDAYFDEYGHWNYHGKYENKDYHTSEIYVDYKVKG
jgi:hypothetical protein